MEQILVAEIAFHFPKAVSNRQLDCRRLCLILIKIFEACQSSPIRDPYIAKSTA